MYTCHALVICSGLPCLSSTAKMNEIVDIIATEGLYHDSRNKKQVNLVDPWFKKQVNSVGTFDLFPTFTFAW